LFHSKLLKIAATVHFFLMMGQIQEMQNFALVQGTAKKSGRHVWHFFRPKITPTPHWTQKLLFKKTTIAP
jgi:hypothetical protein